MCLPVPVYTLPQHALIMTPVSKRRMGGVGEIHVLGPFSPGQGQKLVKSGAITGGFMWNPKEAGKVFVTMGKTLYDGTEITDGMTIPGLGVINPDFANKDIITDNLVAINKDTVDELAALGL